MKEPKARPPTRAPENQKKKTLRNDIKEQRPPISSGTRDTGDRRLHFPTEYRLRRVPVVDSLEPWNLLFHTLSSSPAAFYAVLWFVVFLDQDWTVEL